VGRAVAALTVGGVVVCGDKEEELQVVLILIRV